MRIRWLYVFLAMVVAGCEKSRLSKGGEDVTSKAVSESASTDRSKCEQIEVVLARDLREVPINRRYAAVSQKADDLWDLLDGLSSNNVEYVILVSARFQRELESELQGIEIPRKTMDLGPQHMSKDGTRYYMATREVASEAARQRRSIGDLQEYQKQLLHFLSRYPNRLDAPTMKTFFERLPPDKKAILMEKIVELLGRQPKWGTECGEVESGNGSADDFTRVEENFRRISGRQIRTESQVDADNRAEAERKKAKQR